MRKILALILAFALILSLSVTAFAAGTANTAGDVVSNIGPDDTVSEFTSNDVTKIDAYGLFDKNGDGKVDTNEDTDIKTVYVNIKWDAMNWVYSAGYYDAENMKYEAQWLPSQKKITVTNQSEIGITATPSFTATHTDAGLTFNNGTEGDSTGVLTLEAATPAGQGQAKGTAKSDEILVDIATTTPAISTETKLGTITVTIAPVAENSEDAGA